MNATRIYQEERSKLMQLTHHLSGVLSKDSMWAFSPSFPVFLTSAVAVEEQLKKQHILISSLAYPNKNGRIINRIVLSSWHTLADIEELVLALHKNNLHK